MELQLDLPTARLTLLNVQGLIMWRTPLDRSEIESACFREARVWRAGGVACLGVAERVRFYNLETGALESELALDVLHPSGLSLFGHFGEAILRDGTELLTVLTYTDVIAIDATLEIRWIARNVAVDGVTFAGTREDFILVNAEVGGAVAGRARGEEQGEGWRVAGGFAWASSRQIATRRAALPAPRPPHTFRGPERGRGFTPVPARSTITEGP